MADFLICAAFLAIAARGKAPAAYHWGPIYTLEWVFMIWFATYFFWLKKNWLTLLKHLKPWLFFLTWGVALALFDVFTQPDLLQLQNKYSLQRFIQHCVLFVYPILWTTVGYTFGQNRRNWISGLLYGLCVVSAYTHLANLWFNNDSNMSITWTSDGWAANTALGPLSLFPLLALGWKAFWVGNIAFVAPLVTQWEIYVSRTYLLAILLDLGIAVLFIRQKLIPKAAVIGLTFAIGLISYLTLTPVPSLIKTKAQKQESVSLQDRATFALQHADDVKQPGKADQASTTPSSRPIIQARFRLFNWKTAIQDWKVSPVFGRRFIPEIPSFVMPEWPNTRGLESATAPPVAGPHNSYLTVLTRMGIPGVVLMGWILLSWFQAWRKISDFSETVRMLLFFVPFNGLLYAALNIGLESPHQCVILWFMMGLGVSLAKGPLEFEAT